VTTTLFVSYYRRPRWIISRKYDIVRPSKGGKEEDWVRQYLGPVKAAQVQTELGPIYLTPDGTRGVHVNAPHLTVDGIP
jgi:hypothetical protein